MTLITLTFCEKEGIVRITGLKVLGVLTVDRFDIVSDDDFPFGHLGEIEEDGASGELTLLDLTFSLYTYSNRSSSEWW